MELELIALAYIPMIKLSEIFTLAELTEEERRATYKAILGKEIDNAIKLSIKEKLSRNEPLNALREVLQNADFTEKGRP